MNVLVEQYQTIYQCLEDIYLSLDFIWTEKISYNRNI